MASAIAVLTPDNLAGGGNIVSTDNARSLREPAALPLRYESVWILLRTGMEKVCEVSIVLRNDGAARLFKAARANVVASDVTLSGADG